MFVKAWVTSFRDALRASHQVQAAFRAQPSHLRENCALRATACAARAHFLVAPSAGRATVVRAGALAQAGGARRFAVSQLRRVGKMVARAALRAAYVGNPLTPTGYAILALTVVAVGMVALVAMLSASPISNELEPALRFSNLFS
jgi:hypothetical protein